MATKRAYRPRRAAEARSVGTVLATLVASRPLALGQVHLTGAWALGRVLRHEFHPLSFSE